MVLETVDIMLVNVYPAALQGRTLRGEADF